MQAQASGPQDGPRLTTSSGYREPMGLHSPRDPRRRKAPLRELYSRLRNGVYGRGYGPFFGGTDSALPRSFSESSLRLDTGWNLSRTGGVKMEAFTGGAGVSSVLGGSLQEEVLCRRQPRHVHEVRHQHTGPSEVLMTSPPRGCGMAPGAFIFPEISPKEVCWKCSL